MNRTRILICDWMLIIGGLLSLFAGLAQSSTTPQLSGSYRVILTTEQTVQSQVRLQVHLVNRSARDLTIRRIMLWDLSHPSPGGKLERPLVLRASASTNTTLDFTLPPAELDLWRRGSRPRIVLELANPAGRLSTAIVRLDRASDGKGK